MKKKKILLTLGIAAMMGLAGCGETPTDPQTPVDPPVVTVDPVVTGITLKAAGDKTSLEVGETLQLTATVTGEGDFNKQVTYSVDKTDLAEVSSAGLLTAKAKGTVRVTATPAGDTSKKASLDITIIHSVVTGITLKAEGDATSVQVSETLKFTATVEGEGNFDNKFTFSVDKEDIATISSEGVLTGKAVGTVKVTATAVGDTSKTASLDITINAAPVSDIKDLVVGKYAHVIGKVTSIGSGLYFVDDGTGPLEVYYNGYDGNVPEGITLGKVVELTGIVKDNYGVMEFIGTSGKDEYFTAANSDKTIESTTLDGLNQLDAAGYDAIAKTAAKLTPVKFRGTALEGLEFKVDDASNEKLHVSYASDATKNAIKVGKEYNVIGYMAPYHTKNSYNQLYVAQASEVEYAPQSVSVSGPSSIKVNGTGKFTATLSRTDEKIISNQNVTWTSSVPSVATITEDGTVTGVAEGTTVIKAVSVMDATVFAAANLTVTPAIAVSALTDITGETTLPLHFKESTYSATVSYENETQDTSVSWEIVTESMKEKVEISASGKLTPKENAQFVAGEQIEIKATTTGHTSGNVSLSKTLTVTLRYDGISESVAEEDATAVYTFAGVVSVHTFDSKTRKFLTDGSRFILLQSYATNVSDEDKALIIDGAKLVIDAKVSLYDGMIQATSISSIVAKDDLTVEAPEPAVKGSDYFTAENFETGTLIQFNAYFDGTGASGVAHFETDCDTALPVTCLSAGKTPTAAYKWYKVTAYAYNKFDVNLKVYAIAVEAIDPDPVEPVAPSKVKILNPVTEVHPGQVVNLRAMVYGPAAVQTITWSSDSEKATINSTTGALTGVALTAENEKVTIKATSSADANVFATMEIVVTAIPAQALPSGGLVLTKASMGLKQSYANNKNTHVTVNNFDISVDPDGKENVSYNTSGVWTTSGDSHEDCIQIRRNGNAGQHGAPARIFVIDTPIEAAKKVKIEFFTTVKLLASGEPKSGEVLVSSSFGVKHGNTEIPPELIESNKQSFKSGSNDVYRNIVEYNATISGETLTFTSCAYNAFTPEIISITITNS